MLCSLCSIGFELPEKMILDRIFIEQFLLPAATISREFSNDLR
jgi:hypothetical protein